MKEKIKSQKGFIPILVVIIITIFTITIGAGTVLYETKRVLSFNNVIDSFFNFTSDIIYKIVWQGKYEKELLEHELELSNIKRDQAENRAEEENIARVEAEKKVEEETLKRNEAEAKAKQEEYEKELKEQELSEKEAEEKIMNADNDGDGLSYREELKKGTSDWSDDSDGDGIKDPEDLHPAGGGRHLAQNFDWYYDDTHWTYTLSIPEDWYEYYKNKPRQENGLEYITYDDKYIKEIAEELKSTADKNDYHLSSFIVSFIQGLPYVEDYYTSFDEYPKYPVETIIDRNGDCEDTSYLFASIIYATDIGIVLVEFHNHMGVGILTAHEESGYYYAIGNDWYYYYETTAEGWQVGQLPDDYIGEQAKLIKPWDDSVYYKYPQYKKACDYSSDFSGYYTDGNYYYLDSNCNNLIYCLFYEDFYYNYLTENFYWDSSCGQIFVEGCYKSDTYPGYFYNDALEYYHDSRCVNKARVCRLSSISYDKYYDGYDFYWDSVCAQRVVAGCDKSIYHPGYFFDGWDYYSDYQCIYQVDLY